MSRPRRWRQALGALVLLLAGLAWALRSEPMGQYTCEVLQTRLHAATGLDVSIGSCQVEPLTFGVRLRDLRVAEAEVGAPPLVTIEEASVSLRGFFWGGVDLDAVTLVRPRIQVTLAEPAGTKGPGCPLDALKRLRVRSLEIQEGVLSVTLADQRSVRLTGLDVTASLTRRAAAIEASVLSGTLLWSGDRMLSAGRTRLEATLDLDGRALEVQRAEFNVEGIRGSVKGQVESLCEAAPQLAVTAQLFVPMSSLARLDASLPPAKGQIWSRVAVSGRADAPTVRAELQASQISLGEYTPGDFSARLAYAQGTLRIEEVATKAGEGTLRITGDVQLTTGFPARLHLEASRASFAQVMERASVPGSWVEFPATVRATLEGRLLPTPQLRGEAVFSTGAFMLAARPWNAPAASGQSILGFAESAGSFSLGIDDESVHFSDVKVSVGPRAQTQVSGSVRLFYDARRGLDIRASADALDLADFGAIAELPWQGVGSAKVTVLGPNADVVVDALVSLRDCKFAHYSLGVVQSPVRYVTNTLSFPAIAGQKGKSQYFGALELVFGDRELWTRASVQLPEGRVEDLVELLLDLSPTLENVQGVLTGSVSAVASIDSPARELTGNIALQVSDLEFHHRRFGGGTAVLRFEGGDALVLEPSVFEGPAGQLTVDGRWRFEGPLDYRVALARGRLSEVIDPQGKEGIPIDGELSVDLRVGGDTDVVRVGASVASNDVRWNSRSLGPLHIEVDEVGRDVVARGRVFDGVDGVLHLAARQDWPIEASAAVDLPDLAAFLPASVEGLVLGVRGELSAAGPLRSLRDLRATALLDRLSLARGDVAASNQEPVSLAYRSGQFEVLALSLKGPTTEVTAQGSWGPSTVDLRTQGSVDLRLLSSLVSELERTSGRLDFAAAFSGPVKTPGLAGSAELRDVRFRVKDQDLAVRSLSGRADFSESKVLVHDVEGFLNNGRIGARGEAALERLALSSMALQLDVEDVGVLVRPDIPATLTGELLLAYRNERLQLSGALDVAKLHYTQPLALESVLSSARTRRAAVVESPAEWLWLDVDLSAGEDVRVENNLARAKLVGKVKLSGTNAKPILLGSVEAGTGAQAFFRGNTYAVGRAQLQFNGLWPTFDLAAQTQVREYLVSVKAFGKLDEPKVLLDAEPSLSEADIVSLLTVGVTSREALRAESGLGLAGEALLSASGLDQQVQKFLQRNVGLKDQQVRLTTTFNDATGTAEPSVTWESKVLDNLKLGVTQPVTGKGTRAQAEYRLNPRVSARAQWDNQNQNTTLGNPGVELRFHFEWE